MRKTLLLVCSAMAVIAICTSSIKNTQKISRVTYADGSVLGGGGFSQSGCVGSGCHGTKVSATTTGVISGLPGNNIVTAGTSYTLSVIITDKATTPTAKNWGFDMTSTGGLFTSTNTEVLIEPFSPDFGTEIHHGSTPPVYTATAKAPSYTFDKIVWTAPSTPGKDTFFYACNAGNHDNAATSKDHAMLGAPIILTVNPSTTPVSLASFNVSANAGKVSLSWTTATEINTDHFELERSTDGRIFKIVGTQKAKGTSNAAINYSFADDASALCGTFYYRLKSIDKNGVFNYSAIKSVSLQASKNLITGIYPNPVKLGQSIKFNYNSIQTGNIAVTIINTQGKKVYSTTSTVNAGSNALSIPSGNFASGTYYISVSNGNTSSQKTLIVQ